MQAKLRLDHLVKQLYPELSKTQISSLIMQGHVLVEGVPVTKPGHQVKPDVAVLLTKVQDKFVCRAGHKLEHALQSFGINPSGLIILDAGLSTGGFTDCLLQHGAKLVYGVDVGYGQVHEKIRTDPRVIVMERTNLRHLETLGTPVDLITLDLSFISILKVIEVVHRLLKPHGQLVTLIKPQFEARKHEVGRGGIIKDPAVHQRIVNEVVAGICAAGFEHSGTIESPILGGSGNKEFLAYFRKI